MKKIIGLICILLVLGFVFQKNDDSYDTLWSLIADAEEIGNKDITEILTNQEDIDINTIDDLYIYICEHSDYGYDFSRCSEAEKNYFLLYNFNGEAGNGGIEQFFYNGYEYVEDTLELFKELDWKCSYTYLYEAKQVYPNQCIEMYSDENITDLLNKIDDQYYGQHEKEFYDLIEVYIHENWKELRKES